MSYYSRWVVTEEEKDIFEPEEESVYIRLMHLIQASQFLKSAFVPQCTLILYKEEGIKKYFDN